MSLQNNLEILFHIVKREKFHKNVEGVMNHYLQPPISLYQLLKYKRLAPGLWQGITQDI